MNNHLTTKRGRDVSMRLLAPGDASLLVDLFARLSERTRWLRFSKPYASDDLVAREASRMARSDLAGLALVGVVWEDGEERAVAVAQLVRATRNATVAEVAVVVRDDYQGEGLGKALCQQLTMVAAQGGIATLQAFTRVENRALQRLVRSLGLPYTSDVHRGELTLNIQLPVC